MKSTLTALVAAALLTGCSTQACRIRDCEDQGISRDTCYLAEKNHQAAMSAVAEKQALENQRVLFDKSSSDTSRHSHKHH